MPSALASGPVSAGPEARPARRAALLRFVTGVVLLVAVLALLTWLGLTDVTRVRAAVQAAGPAAPAAYVLGYALTGALPVPRWTLTVTGGILFGPVAGSTLAWLGAVSGGAVGYAAGAAAGRALVEKYGGPKVAWVEERLARGGTLAIIALRIFPAAPYVVVNLTSGALAVAPRPYGVGTALGTVPGSVAAALVGAGLAG